MALVGANHQDSGRMNASRTRGMDFYPPLMFRFFQDDIGDRELTESICSRVAKLDGVVKWYITDDL